MNRISGPVLIRYNEYEIFVQTDRESWNEADYYGVKKDGNGNLVDEFDGHVSDYKNIDFLKAIVDERIVKSSDS